MQSARRDRFVLERLDLGSIWTRQSTETQLGLTDIAGDETGLYACGSESWMGHGIVLRKDGTVWRKVIEGFVPGADTIRASFSKHNCTEPRAGSGSMSGKRSTRSEIFVLVSAGEVGFRPFPAEELPRRESGCEPGIPLDRAGKRLERLHDLRGAELDFPL